MNDGDGTFTDMKSSSGLPYDGGYRGAIFVDYNNDGWFDVFLRGPGYNVSLFRNNQDSTFTDVSNSAFSNRYLNNDTQPYGPGLTTADFDNDGYMDVLALGQRGTDTKLYQNNGNGTFSNVAGAAGIRYDGPGIWSAPLADYNLDGYVDIFMARNHNDFLPTIFENDGGTNHWLHLKLTGVESNASAVGARLVCYSADWLQMQQVTGGLSYQANSLTVEFGLGDAQLVDSLIIHWPSGAIQKLMNVPVDTLLNVSEQDGEFYIVPFMLYGNVTYHADGSGIPQVEVTLTGAQTGSEMTDTAGEFNFQELGAQGPLLLTPSKPRLEDAAGAVSAYDAAMVARYNFGLCDISADQFQSADVNGDSVLNMFDAVFIARASVGMPNQPETSAGEWKFDPEQYEYSGIGSNLHHQDFEAKLMGDVNGNWPSLYSPSKSIPSTSIAVPDTIRIGIGERFEVIVHVSDTMDFISFDLCAQFDPEALELVEVSKTDFMEGHTQVYHTDEKGGLKCASFGAHEKRGPGQLVEMVFRVVDPKDEYVKIEWKRFLLDTVLMKKQSTVIHVEKEPKYVDSLTGFHLDGYPNPFNPDIVFQYEVREHTDVSIIIYNIMGNPVRRLLNRQHEEGEFRVVWDGKDDDRLELPGGMYFCRMIAGDEIKVLKVVKMR